MGGTIINFKDLPILECEGNEYLHLVLCIVRSVNPTVQHQDDNKYRVAALSATTTHIYTEYILTEQPQKRYSRREMQDAAADSNPTEC